MLDGTEIAALLISKRSQLLKVGDVILLFNVVLFLAAMSVLGVEPALYSILTYVTAARTLDFVIYGLEEYTAITIVSSQSAAIRERITGELGRGVTVYKGYGGLTGAEQQILYCVVTRLEIGKVKAIVRAVDEHAFIVSHVLADAEGGVVKRAGAALRTRISRDTTWISICKLLCVLCVLSVHAARKPSSPECGLDPPVGHQPHQRDEHVDRVGDHTGARRPAGSPRRRAPPRSSP